MRYKQDVWGFTPPTQGLRRGGSARIQQEVAANRGSAGFRQGPGPGGAEVWLTGFQSTEVPSIRFYQIKVPVNSDSVRARPKVPTEF